MKLRSMFQGCRVRAGVLGIAGALGIFSFGFLTGRVAAETPVQPGVEQPADGALASLATAGPEPPIGVLNASPLEKGAIRLGYRYTRTWMRGNWDGRHRVKTSRVYDQQSPAYLSAPRKSQLQQHLVSAAWAPFSRLTLVARLPIYVHQGTTDRAVGGSFRTRTEGVGDLRVMALVPFMRKGDETLVLSFGFRAPTGSVRETGTVVTGTGLEDGRLAYFMQPGKGSWALVPGVTYRGHWKRLSWGGQYQGGFYLNKNSQGYRSGTEQEVSTWMAWNWTMEVSTSVRFSWHRQSNTHGGDSEIGRYPYADPADDPMRQGGQQLVMGPGVNLRLPFLHGQTLGFEALFPVWRDVKGPQPGSRWQLHAGLNMDF